METGPLLKALCLPPMEITTAADCIRAESGVMPPEEMTRAAARLLGFLRVGSELADTIFSIVMND